MVENPGVFFVAQRVDAKTPSSPRISPHLHHQNTTAKATFSRKTPAKTTNHQPQKKFIPNSELS
jgi:hypothetical protein